MDIFLSITVLLPKQLPLLTKPEVGPDNTSDSLICLGLFQNPNLVTIVRASITICSLNSMIHLCHKDFFLFRGLYGVTNFYTEVMYVN